MISDLFNKKVYFWKENWEEILINENGVYNKKYCPKLHEISKKIKKE